MTPWLVVEDEEDIRNIVTFMFEQWGHPPIAFRDGNQAFDWLDQVEMGTYDAMLPDLALLDIRMPGPRGNEIARRMRSLDPFRDIPIVIMTAFSLSERERDEMYDIDGVDHIISKPLPDFFELKSLLEEIYESRYG